MRLTEAGFDVTTADGSAAMLAEAFSNGRTHGLIFTDPMQADDVAPGALQAVYDRLHLNDLGSMRFYRHAAETTGFGVVEQEDLLHHLRTHNLRVPEELQANETTLRDAGASLLDLSKMTTRLQDWVAAADAGQLAWGIQVFRKPARSVHALGDCRWITNTRYYMGAMKRMDAQRVHGHRARKRHGHGTDARS